MSAFVKVHNYVQALGDKLINLNTDTICVYLTNAAIDAATARVQADAPEIATGHGYGGPIDIHNAYSQTGGVGIMTGDASVLITATGGSIGPLRNAVLWDQTANLIIGYWDYGAPLTLLDTNTLLVNLNPEILTLV